MLTYSLQVKYQYILKLSKLKLLTIIFLIVCLNKLYTQRDTIFLLLYLDRWQLYCIFVSRVGAVLDVNSWCDVDWPLDCVDFVFVRNSYSFCYRLRLRWWFLQNFSSVCCKLMVSELPSTSFPLVLWVGLLLTFRLVQIAEIPCSWYF